jgi:CheY-like chemotaxis protein
LPDHVNPHSVRQVLIVEDNPTNRKLVVAQLKKLGIEPHVAVSGSEAVKACATNDYGLILMDCQMPEVDGFAVTKLIRKAEERSGRHVSIVAVTASAMTGDRQRCLEVGMDDYQSKPMSLDQLQQILDRWLPPDATRTTT